MFLKIKKIPKVNWSSKKPYNFKIYFLIFLRSESPFAVVNIKYPS